MTIAPVDLRRLQYTAQGEHSRRMHLARRALLLPSLVSPGKMHNRDGTTGQFAWWKHGQTDSRESGRRVSHHGSTNSVPVGRWESSS